VDSSVTKLYQTYSHCRCEGRTIPCIANNTSHVSSSTRYSAHCLVYRLYFLIDALTRYPLILRCGSSTLFTMHIHSLSFLAAGLATFVIAAPIPPGNEVQALSSPCPIGAEPDHCWTKNSGAAEAGGLGNLKRNANAEEDVHFDGYKSVSPFSSIASNTWLYTTINPLYSSLIRMLISTLQAVRNLPPLRRKRRSRSRKTQRCRTSCVFP
jgi:hypothetical protein